MKKRSEFSFFMFRVKQQIGWNEDMVQAVSKMKIAAAILDTGISNHPDLKGSILDFKDFVHGKSQIYDECGHGTHVSGIICGSGAISAKRYCGIAPGMKLVVGKVLDEKGDGNVENMVAGLEWILRNKDKYGIRILNVSIGTGTYIDATKEEILKDMLRSAWQKGLVVVCAAGNSGPKDDTVSSIGKSPYLLTVGCHDGEYYAEKTNRCSTYSGRGALLDTVRKPDIVAPGTEIISCNHKYEWGRKGYTSKSGTSMATPVISGAVGVLLSKYPEFDNETAKRKILYTARDLNLPWNEQGWGMVDMTKMMKE